MTQRMWRRGPDGEILRVTPAPADAGPESPRAGASGEEAPAQRKKASLALALRLGFRDTYDYMGTVLLISAAGSILAALGLLGGRSLGLLIGGRLPGYLPLLLSLLGAVIGGMLVLGPTAAGAFRFARNAAAREEPEVFDLAWGFRSALPRALLLGIIQTLMSSVLVANAAFYLAHRHPVAAVMGAVFGYALLFWLLLCSYTWPLLAEQEIGPGRVLKKAALLVLDNPGFTIGLGAVVGVLTVLLWLTMVGGILLWGGMVAMLLTQATRELLRRYDVLPPDPTLDPVAAESE